MPTYRYRCGTCGDELELWQSITDDPLTEHVGCGGDLVKVLSPAGIVLKGSGFYKTDSRKGSKGNGAGTSKPTDTKTGDGSSGAGKSGSSTPDSGASSASTSSTKKDGSSGSSGSGSTPA
jgi:putative FmdB family regulatory protein